MNFPSYSSRLITLTTLDEQYKLWNSSLWSLLRPPSSFLLGPNIRLRIQFSNTLSQHSSLYLGDQVSQQWTVHFLKIIIIIIIIIIITIHIRIRSSSSSVRVVVFMAYVTTGWIIVWYCLSFILLLRLLCVLSLIIKICFSHLHPHCSFLLILFVLFTFPISLPVKILKSAHERSLVY